MSPSVQNPVPQKRKERKEKGREGKGKEEKGKGKEEKEKEMLSESEYFPHWVKILNICLHDNSYDLGNSVYT
jgi:hypothetical protein